MILQSNIQRYPTRKKFKELYHRWEQALENLEKGEEISLHFRFLENMYWLHDVFSDVDTQYICFSSRAPWSEEEQNESNREIKIDSKDARLGLIIDALLTDAFVIYDQKTCVAIDQQQYLKDNFCKLCFGSENFIDGHLDIYREEKEA